MNLKRSLLALLLLPALSWPIALGTASAQAVASSSKPAGAGLYIPPSCQGRPLAANPSPGTAKATLKPHSSLTPAQQLQVFRGLVSAINDLYVYPDFNGRDWPALVARTRARVESGLETETFYAELQKLVSELGDEHSYFLSPARVAEDEARLVGRRDFVGVGLLMMPLLEKSRVTILAVFPESSALHGGLKPHDSILAVDGIPLVENGKSYPERILGPECSAPVFTVESPGQAARRLTLVRHRQSAALPVDARLVPTTDSSRIGYIFLPTFLDKTIPDKVKRALQEFGPLDALILDNRMNGGGSSSVLMPILSHFASGTLGHFVKRAARRPLEVTPDPVHNSQTVPLVILVSKNTVSYAEVFSGSLQDTGRARLVGQTTKGNVETLHAATFADGSKLWIAAERFDPRVSHANWENQGVKPEVEVLADWDTFTFANDPGVAAAVRLLGHK